MLIPLSGCKILKLPITIVKSIGEDIGEAVGITKEEKKETAIPKNKHAVALPSAAEEKSKANFKSLVVWSMIVVVMMIALRMAVKRSIRNKSK